MKHLAHLLVLSTLLAVSSASAEEKSTNTITLKPIDVVGNPRRPSAVVEVAKNRMQLPPSTPTLAAASKIHDAARKDPF